MPRRPSRIGHYGTFLLTLAAAVAQGEILRAEPASRPLARAGAGLTFSRFEQQVKTEVGGARGQRLVENTEFGLLLTGTYVALDYFEVGVFAQGDLGFRSSARFAGFDEAGAAETTDRTGGGYRELWVGPLLRGRYGPAFIELGWGAVGLRWDDARDDLPSTTGDTEGALVRDPAIAWLIAAGAAVPLTTRLDLVLRLEYRVRYYTSRGGDALENDIAHGTQSFTPFFGFGYALGSNK